jgi:hypothetical protein
MNINLDSNTYNTFKVFSQKLAEKANQQSSDENDTFKIIILFYYELFYEFWHNIRKNLTGKPLRVGTDYLEKFARIFINRIVEKLERISISGQEDISYYTNPISVDTRYFKMLTDLSIEIMENLTGDELDLQNPDFADAFSPLNKNMLSEILSAMILCINENFTNDVFATLVRFHAGVLQEKLKNLIKDPEAMLKLFLNLKDKGAL